MMHGLFCWIKRRIRGTVYRLGYQMFKIPITRPDAYECIHPIADYAPWNLDPAFKEVYGKIEHATYVDKYRCHELWWLVFQSAKLETGSLLEVGAWRGGTGTIIASRARQCGLTDPVYICDTFRGVVKAGRHDPVYRGGEHMDTSQAEVERLLQKTIGVDGVRVLPGVFPDESGAELGNDRLRFCHIHVDVYNSARDVTDWIWGRLVMGGIVVYDDFGFQGCDGVTRFVEEMADRPDRVVIANLNGHAVVVKIADPQLQASPSM